MIHSVIDRHSRRANRSIVASRPYMESMGLTKAKAVSGEAAMLYAIDAKSNKSKYYEMLILEDRAGYTLHRRWGRLGDKFQTKQEEFSDLDTAKRALMKIKSSKMRGSSKYRDAFDSRTHKTPDGKQLPKGQYPIGLSSNAGPWQNQNIQTCKPAIRQLITVIEEAIADAANEDMSGVLTDLQLANGYVSELGTSSMAKEIRKKIKAPLSRLTGMGRHQFNPAKTVKELKTLSRYLSKQMSMCMTASVVDRTASTKTAGDYRDSMPTFLFLKEQEAHDKGRALSKSVTFSWLRHMEKVLGRDSKPYWKAVKEALLKGYGPLQTRISPTAVVGTGYRKPTMVALDWVEQKLTGKSKYFDKHHKQAAAEMDKTAGGHDDLMEILGNDQIRTLTLLRRNLHGATEASTQTANLLSKCISEMAKKVKLDSNTKTALNKMRNLDDNMNADMARNQIFKIADLLGVKLPSAMFASEKTASKYSPSSLFGGIGSARLLSAFQVLGGLNLRGVSKRDAIAIISQMTALRIPSSIKAPSDASKYDLEKWLDWLADWAASNGQMEWHEPYGWAVPAAAARGWMRLGSEKNATSDEWAHAFLNWLGNAHENLIGEFDVTSGSALISDLWQAISGHAGYPREGKAQTKKIIAKFMGDWLRAVDEWYRWEERNSHLLKEGSEKTADNLEQAWLGKTKTAIRFPLDGARKHELMPSGVANKIPKLYEQDGVEDPMCYVKFFNPYGRGVWYVTEFDGRETMFGYAKVTQGELGYISLSELANANRNGLPLIERDRSWKPRPLSQAKGT